MAAAGAAGDGEKSGFRWLDLARYAVAAVVTVVIIAVVVHAIQVVFRPDSLTLSVLGGSVSTNSLPPATDPSLSFSYTLRARNPSGRVRMYYFNINTFLFNSSTPATTPEPMADCLVSFQLPDMSVMQMRFTDSLIQRTVQRNPNDIMPFAFDALHKTGGSIKDVTMLVNGTLVTEIRFGFNTTPRVVKYYCRQLVVGLYDVATMKTDQETSCTTSS
ncbi:hypothetical protein SEVIR_4G013400v4 [Setaria viridis]|uniref:Late embryogenesis abundant protein LEA-2 subgroup domain-containing protein n=1 Tax=Setaria viridis TaxID=4556 RepID=A0A4U6UX64_SETVI|nr:hypothetical protein SEVIR_4G013400v2 [Setaria viridis]